MNDIQRIQDAFLAADKAGNTEDAQVFADELRRMRAVENNPDELRAAPASAKDVFFNSVGFGLTDEVSAAGAATGQAIGNLVKGAPQQFGQDYTDALATERQGLRRYAEDNPGMNTALQTGGALVGGGASLGPRVVSTAGRSTPAIVTRAAAEGGALGAAHGYGMGEGLEGSLKGAGYGLAGGAIVGAGAGALGARMATGNAPRPPTSSQLRTRANAAYQASEDAGAVVRADSFELFVEKLTMKMRKKGFRPRLQEKAAAALDEFSSGKGMPKTLEDLDELRQVLSGIEGSASEGRMAAIMRNKLDDWMDGLRGKDILAGDAPAAIRALKEGRQYWHRLSKTADLERAIDRATRKSSMTPGLGIDKALQQEFKTFSLNDRAMRGYSQMERNAIERVAGGGSPEKILRWTGKAAPTGIVSGALSTGGGYALGGPMGAIGLPVAGATSKLLTRLMTSRNARLTAEQMRRGGPAIRSSLSNQQQALVRGLQTGGADGPRNLQQLLEGY